jgi:sortase A
VAETRTQWFTYVIDRTRIVSPSSVWVLDPVPGKPRATPTDARITLTTCNPRWASYERLIIFGHLRESRSKASGPPAALGRAGGDA